MPLSNVQVNPSRSVLLEYAKGAKPFTRWYTESNRGAIHKPTWSKKVPIVAGEVETCRKILRVGGGGEGFSKPRAGCG